MEKEKQRSARALNHLVRAVKLFLRDRFNLHEDQAGSQETMEEIKKGVVFRGANLWVLMFAILIASIGLNVNSTAVIIGAMLISPLMGPIMGVGLGVGVNDSELIIQALKNLGIAVGISILTSALYFAITPLNQAQSELLARTTPTLWDVLIALFGGLAGIVAGSRREKSNAIPGVAIATALMPPLCTAGYGLGTLQWNYFIGAFYLFFINSVFISLSTFVIVRALGYPSKSFVDPAREQRVRRYIMIFAVLTIIPSIFTAYQVVRKSVFEQKANLFVGQEFQFNGTQVIHSKVSFERGRRQIEVTLLGEPLDSGMENRIRARLAEPNYRLADADLVIHQGYRPRGVDQQAVEQMSLQMRSGIIEELYKRNEELVRSKDARIGLLEKEILRLRSRELPVMDLAGEVKALNKNVMEFSIASTVMAKVDSLKPDTCYLAYLHFRRRPARQELSQLEAWLKARIKSNSLRMVTN